MPALLAGGCLLLLTACDPYIMPDDPHSAEVVVRIGTQGDADVQLRLGGRTVRTDDELTRIGTIVAPTILPRSDSVRVNVDHNGGGSPFVRIAYGGVYESGRAPAFSFDSAALVRVLDRVGFPTVGFSLTAPVDAVVSSNVPPTRATDHSASWDGLTTSGSLPAGTMGMRTHVGAAAVSLLMLVAALVGIAMAALGARRRRRWLGLAGAGLCLAAGAATVVRAGGVAANDLAVAGFIGRTAVTVIDWTVVALLLGVPIAILFAMDACKKRPDRSPFPSAGSGCHPSHHRRHRHRQPRDGPLPERSLGSARETKEPVTVRRQ